MRTQILVRRMYSSGAVAMLLGVIMLSGSSKVQADSTFNVSATFTDNGSTPLTGTITINTATGAIDGFNFNIPEMTTGSTTLNGAMFNPLTATPNFSNDLGTLGSFITFQLFGAPPNSEQLYLLIPQSTLVNYTGGSLLQVVSFEGTDFHTGYQSGAQSNPFFEISGNGLIAMTPEPSSLILLGAGLLGLAGFSFKKAIA